MTLKCIHLNLHRVTLEITAQEDIKSSFKLDLIMLKLDDSAVDVERDSFNQNRTYKTAISEHFY